MKDAILENDLEKIRSLIQQDPHFVNGSLTEQGCKVYSLPYQLIFCFLHIGSTAVMIASSIGNLAILKVLVEEYLADINLTNHNGTTALVFACNTNQLEVVTYLCEHGADVNSVIESGDTPLTIASSNGYDDIIRVILSSHQGPIDHHHQNSEGKTALLCAIENGHPSTVSTLIASEEGRAAINLISEVSTVKVSPLVVACLYGEIEIVQILLSHQADTSLISDRILCSQRSPKYDNDNEDEAEIQCSFNQNEFQLHHRPLIRLELLAAGWLPRLDVRRCCELDDVNSLQCLLKDYEYSPEVLSLLTNNIVSSSGYATGLMVACLHGSLKVVEEIFTLATSYPAHLNLRCTTPDCRNALFYAVWNGHSTLLRYLLENGFIDLINVLNSKQESPLYYACTNGHPDCVSILLQNGAEIQHDKITDECVCSTPILPSDSPPDLVECKRKEILTFLGR